jgi:FixJ family two-component response regulator
MITDVIIPGMTGPDLVAKLRTGRTGLVVLYMSGYDRQQIGANALERAASFLPKPFTPADLLAGIAELYATHRQAVARTRSAAP